MMPLPGPAVRPQAAALNQFGSVWFGGEWEVATGPEFPPAAGFVSGSGKSETTLCFPFGENETLSLGFSLK